MKQISQNRNKTDHLFCFLIAASFMAGMIVWFHTLSPFSFATNDDFYLRWIVSGAVTGTPQARLCHIGYPAGLLISTCYRIWPTLPWYGLFLCFSAGLSLAFVLYGILITEKRWIPRAVTLLCAAVVLYGMLFYHFAEIQYTLVTETVSAGAAFCFLMAPLQGRFREDLRSHMGFLFLSIWAFGIRNKAYLMLLPIFGMLWIVKAVGTDRKGRRSLIILVSLLSGVLLLLTGIQRLAYGSSQWQAFLRYNTVRETVYDYHGYPDYAQNRALYQKLGITESSYQSASAHYELQLDAHYTADAMETLAAAGRQTPGQALKNLPEKAAEMALAFLERHLSYTDRPLNLLVYAFTVLIIVLAIAARHKKAVLEVCCLFIGSMVIWCYLLYIGRFPARVTQGIYLTELLVLTGILCRNRLWQSEKNGRLQKVLFSAVLCVLLAVVVRFGFPKAAAAREEASSRVAFSAAYTEVDAYFQKHQDALYLLDMNSFGSFTEDALKGGGKGTGNSMLLGSWPAHSPWYAEKLGQMGITDLRESVLTDSRIYLVFLDTPQTGWDYLQKDYQETNPDAVFHVVDTVTTENGLTFQILQGSTEK